MEKIIREELEEERMVGFIGQRKFLVMGGLGPGQVVPRRLMYRQQPAVEGVEELLVGTNGLGCGDARLTEEMPALESVEAQGENGPQGIFHEERPLSEGELQVSVEPCAPTNPPEACPTQVEVKIVAAAGASSLSPRGPTQPGCRKELVRERRG